MSESAELLAHGLDRHFLDGSVPTRISVLQSLQAVSQFVYPHVDTGCSGRLHQASSVCSTAFPFDTLEVQELCQEPKSLA